MRILQPRRRQLTGQAFDFPVAQISSGPKITMWSALQLGAAGASLARKCAAQADSDYNSLKELFLLFDPPPANFIVAPLSHSSDGSGGAYHHGCADPTLYCDAAPQNPKLTNALFVAELVEVFEALQNRGWDCGATNGEGLSRVLAENLYPGVLDGYSEAAAWLDSQRENFVDQNLPTDTDAASNGCAVLFLWWEISLGYTWTQIVQAAGASLNDNYVRLTGKTSAWQDFRAAVDARWPVGQPSGVTIDNAWSGAPIQPSTQAILEVRGVLPPGYYRSSDDFVIMFTSAPMNAGRYPLTAPQ
jgi:hypothetical protein